MTARTALMGLDAVMAANALGGAWYGLAGAPEVPRKWLAGTPFHSYRVPAVVLGAGVGGTQVAALAALARRDRRAKPVSTLAGGVLVGWIAAQVALIGYRSPLQPAVAAWGLGTLALSRRLAGEEGGQPPDVPPDGHRR
jgi:hypothetical protein